MGDIINTVGVILSTMGDTQYRGEIMIHVGRYHEYLGGVQYRGDIIFCNLSTMEGYHNTCGDIMSTMGCSVP